MTTPRQTHAMAAASRRDFLRLAGLAGGATWLARFTPAEARWLQAGSANKAAGLQQVAERRALLGASPIARTPLGDNIFLLSGPGGNVVVLHGPDGTVAVDAFVQPAWPKLKATLDALAPSRLALLINTHWHFDHTDNNAVIHAAGGKIVAHANTKTRLNEVHDIPGGMYFDPAPAGALPAETFTTTWTHRLNGEELALGSFKPAHTDTDIYVRFPKANVLHMGDVFFNGVYPNIDATTGGRIDGMVEGATRGLAMADARTKVVPGHGPLGDKAALLRYRDMLAAVRDRVQKLKTAGRTLPEVQQAKPTAGFDAQWGSGRLNGDGFVALVYGTSG